MKHVFVALSLLLALGCGSSRPSTSSPVDTRPGVGAITIAIEPNPIMARRVSGNMYDFPFEVIVRETGGRRVNVQRVRAEVLALGSIRVASETYDAARINQLGYQTTVPANGELRYRFNPRREVPDDRLFGGVSAEIVVEAVDDGGTPVSARTTVTVTR